MNIGKSSKRGKYKNVFAEMAISATKQIEFWFAAVLVYLEIAFHIIRFDGTKNVGYKIIFGMLVGVIVGYLVGLLPSKAQKIATYILTFFFGVYFIAQIVYSGVFNTFLSISGTFEVQDQALDFTDVVFKELKEEFFYVLIMLVPGILFSVILRKWVSFRRHALKGYLVKLAGVFVVFLFVLFILQFGKKEMYSAYSMYKKYESVDMSVEKLGVIETFYLDTKAGIKNAAGAEADEAEFIAVDTKPSGTTGKTTEKADNKTTEEGGGETGTDEQGEVTTEEQVTWDTSPNVFNLDFDALAEKESNKNIKSLHQYVASATPTNKNKYTGMFEGYNVIWITAEGFDGYVIDKDRTPTLYKLSTEGFNFKNFYNPLWYGSTLGGEYANLVGLAPANGGYLSMKKAGKNKNDMYLTISQQLKRKGYTCKGFHNNDYKYYGRNVSHPNLGLEWIGKGSGYEPELSKYNNALWPQSDLYMEQQTFSQYSSEEHFYTYYLTVSGHVLYNFSGNAMSIRHKDLVQNLNYSETTKAYIACQQELELMLTQLIVDLNNAGIADKTLIVLAADHVPYDNKEVVDELAGRTLGDEMEWYKNTAIIWSASMTEPVVVDKVCMSLDLLPTVSNLLGLEYDSRMLAGQDIMSDSEGLVMFNSRSWITDRCSYNVKTKEVKSFGEPVSDEYVSQIKSIVSNKFNMSKSICDNDYYKYVHKAIGN